MKVWIVGKCSRENHLEWEFQGVFDSEQEAVEVCEDEFWFVGPTEMNEQVPVESVTWPDSYFPNGRRWMTDEEKKIAFLTGEGIGEPIGLVQPGAPLRFPIKWVEGEDKLFPRVSLEEFLESR